MTVINNALPLEAAHGDGVVKLKSFSGLEIPHAVMAIGPSYHPDNGIVAIAVATFAFTRGRRV